MKPMSGSALSSPATRGRRFGRWSGLLLGAALSLGACLVARPTSACGGFFCSATNPVNQAAERIVFAQNGDGTVTAVIEIQYQGPSTSFSWLLPISSVPMGDQIQVASNAAFQQLQQATNPQYNLQVRVEGTCSVEPESTRKSSGPGGFANGPTLAGGDSSPGVMVEASGIVGSFEWTVISLDAKLSDPADAAVTWLGENGYDVPDGARGLIGPYLADGLYLLALKLKKGASTGSIRPIVLTYAAEKPMIPIKLTAVAANENMGVLTWILGDSRAVPMNYNALELNEARINWFSASSNYNQVVTAAADDAGGQGFVTELAGPTTQLKGLIWTQFMQQAWTNVQGASSALQAYQLVTNNFSGLDGLGDVIVAHATFQTGVTPEQVRACPDCYQPTSVDAAFLSEVETNVIKPMRVVQDLIDAHPQVTRLYTTMSASEMTVDPLFSFNPDLESLNNIHTAQRVIECGPGYYQSSAPWRIELPQGGVIRGGPSTLGTWPTAFDSQPPNRRVLRQGESGSGKVLEDNMATIQSALTEYGKTVEVPANSSSSGCQLAGPASQSGAWAGLLLALTLLGQGRRRARGGRVEQRKEAE